MAKGTINIKMNLCSELHTIVRKGERFTIPFDETIFPVNGIYILFEKGENGHDGERIVRVGINRENGRFRKRLRNHFMEEQKDNSIFRKNIGRALLNKHNDPFLSCWDSDLSPRDNFDKSKLASVEKQVTDYMNRTFSFVILKVAPKKLREDLEPKLVSTISWCKLCKSSEDWLGRYSTVQKIHESGLWQVQGLYKKPIEESDLDEIVKRLVCAQ